MALFRELSISLESELEDPQRSSEIELQDLSPEKDPDPLSSLPIPSQVPHLLSPSSSSLPSSDMRPPQEREEGEVKKSSPTYYLVEEGDTLIRISMKLNISMARLKKFNHLFGKNDVMVGQVYSLSLSLAHLPAPPDWICG